MARRVGLVALVLAALSDPLVRGAERDIDFRNFVYPFPADDSLPVPSKLAWMSMSVKTTVKLVNGRYYFDQAEPSRGPSLILDRVQYGYLTSAKQLDAVVVLGYHTGGTAYWNYVYAFSLESNSPKLIGWFRAGSRADFGLYRVEVTNGGLVVDLFDPEHRAADCCSEGFVRTRYKFKNGYFVQTGPLEFGKIEDSAPKTK
jgi:hypothetical protein